MDELAGSPPASNTETINIPDSLVNADPHQLVHTFVNWVMENGSTGIMVIDVALFAIVLIPLLMILVNPRRAFESLTNAIWDKFFSISFGKYHININYNTFTNKYGDTSPMDCDRNNEYLLKAVFSYLEKLGKLKEAEAHMLVKDEEVGYTPNPYLRMKNKDIQLHPVPVNIAVDRDITIQVLNNSGEEESSKMKKLAIVVYSRTSFEACRKFAQKAFDYWIDKKYKHYDEEDTGKKLRYYSVRSIADDRDIIWNQFPLGTSRSFDYLFFNEKPKVMQLIDKFIESGLKVSEVEGPAYKLGFLLYGKPGCGKTSFIKALANYTKRHIFDIHLNKFKKNSQLRDAFFMEKIQYSDHSSTVETIKVPLKQRIIIMEDIDALSDVVMKRSANTSYRKDAHMDFSHLRKSGNTIKNEEDDDDEDEDNKKKKKKKKDDNLEDELEEEDNKKKNKKKKSDKDSDDEDDEDKKKKKGDDDDDDDDDAKSDKGEDDAPVQGPSMSGFEKWSKKKEAQGDKLNLGALLSILDGTLELTGPIVVMSTNHPEHLDPALIRSGRVTKQIYFGDLDVNSLVEMLEFYYGPYIPPPSEKEEEVDVEDKKKGQKQKDEQEEKNKKNSAEKENEKEEELVQPEPPMDVERSLEMWFPGYQVSLDEVIPPNDLEGICTNNRTMSEAVVAIANYVYGENSVRALSIQGAVNKNPKGVLYDPEYKGNADKNNNNNSSGKGKQEFKMPLPGSRLELSKSANKKKGPHIVWRTTSML